MAGQGLKTAAGWFITGSITYLCLEQLMHSCLLRND